MKHERIPQGLPSAPVTVSVVICAHTLDRWDDLSRAVASVRAQIPAAHEILVAIGAGVFAAVIAGNGGPDPSASVTLGSVIYLAGTAATVIWQASLGALVVRDGTRLDPIPRAIELAAHGDEVPLGAYLDLDDVTIGAAFAAWCDAKDPVLADLCRRLRVRRAAG